MESIKIIYEYYKERTRIQFLTLEYLEKEIEDDQNTAEEIERYKQHYIIETEKLEILRQIKGDLNNLRVNTKEQ